MLTLMNFVSGSLGAYLASQVAAALTGPTPSLPPPYGYTPQLSLFNDGARNAGWWTALTTPVDVTCIPMSSSKNGTLIAPDVMLFASHYNASSTVTFADNSGNPYTRGIVDTTYITDPVGDNDILLGLLDSALPVAITPALVLPSNFRSYLPQPQYGYAGFSTNQDRTIVTGDLISDSGGFVTMSQPLDMTRQKWWYAPRVGDSGSGMFLPIGGYSVLLGAFHYVSGNVGLGPVVADNIDQINSAISEQFGSASELTIASLSSFTSY